MLSNQKLVDALYQYINENGLDGFMFDYRQIPSTRIDTVPSYLVDRNEAQRLLARNSRVSPSESISDKALSPAQEEKWGVWDYSPLLALEDCISKAEANLSLFLRSHFQSPNLTVKLNLITNHTLKLNNRLIVEKLPFGLYIVNPMIYVTCSIPDTEGKHTPETTASAILNYLIQQHTIIGPDYTTICDIEIEGPEALNTGGAPKEGTNPTSVQPRNIEQTFLYKTGTALSPEEKDDLANGSPRMLLSREAEFRVLISEFLSDSLYEGLFMRNRGVQRRTLLLMASLISGGKLFKDNFKALNTNFSCSTDPNDSNKIDFRSVCTASASFGKHKDVDIELVLGGTLFKTVNNEKEVTYSLGKCYVQLDSKNKDALKTLAGSEKQNLRFEDDREKITASYLTSTLIRNLRKYFEANLKVKSSTDKSNHSAGSSLENSSSGDSNSKPTSAAKVETSISPTDKPLVGTQDKKDNPETQQDIASTPKVNVIEKPSLLRRILGIPVSIVKFIFNVIVKCITFPFSLVARCCSKVVGLFCSKPSSTDASLNSHKQTTSVASNTSKGQSTETVGKVAPAKDKGGASPAEQSKHAASAGPAKETTITSDVKSDAPDSIVKAPTIASDKSALASAPAAR